MHHPHRIIAAIMVAMIAITNWWARLSAEAHEITPTTPDYVIAGDGEIFMI